ncbi:putative GIY-YIG protein [Ochrobactrum phage vB_OspM_OC]|nr:putative GIY-YIG protein [Ochrobactrum phage vB_OspM_OC]
MIINAGLSQGAKAGCVNNATGEFCTNWYLTSDGMGEISFTKNHVIGFKDYNPGGKLYFETIIELSREYIKGERYVFSFDASTVDYPKAKIKARLTDDFGNVSWGEFTLRETTNQFSMVVVPDKRTDYRLRIVLHDKSVDVVNAQCKSFQFGNFRMNRGIEPDIKIITNSDDVQTVKRVFREYDELVIDICKTGNDRFTATATWNDPMRLVPKVSFTGLKMKLFHKDYTFTTDIMVDTRCVLNSHISPNGITVKCFFEDVYSGSLSQFFSRIETGEWFKGIVEDHVIFDSRIIP